MSILDKLQQMAVKVRRDAAAIDARAFGDPIAEQTAWTPLVQGGSSFRTHQLTPVEPDGMAMTKTIQMMLFALVFLAVGLGIIIAGLSVDRWYLPLFGAIFAASGAYMIWPRKILFDGNTRKFISPSRSVAFSEIHAIQLVRERVSSSDNGDFWSYELNLVLKAGDRLNVTDHGDLESLRADANRLRVLLGCKLWDATVPVDHGSLG